MKKKRYFVFLITCMFILTSCGQIEEESKLANNAIADVTENNPAQEKENEPEIKESEEELKESEEELKEGEEEIKESEPEAKEESDITNQLQIIVNNKSLWIGDDSDSALYSYAITDLNQNGRVEIISSSIQGTGMYTRSYYWEVNESFDGLKEYKHKEEEYSSEADIVVNTVPVYFDSTLNRYYYVFDDLLKNGAAQYYENKRAIYLENEQIIEIFLAYKATIYIDTDPTITITDANSNTISEEEYNNIADQFFVDMEKKQANIGWASTEILEMKEKSEADLLSM